MHTWCYWEHRKGDWEQRGASPGTLSRMCVRQGDKLLWKAIIWKEFTSRGLLTQPFRVPSSSEILCHEKKENQPGKGNKEFFGGGCSFK